MFSVIWSDSRNQTFVNSGWHVSQPFQETELPDGLFSDQKLHFGDILEGLAMKDVAVFDGRLVYFRAT
jgi:hypothetical protein